jgi:hypothetical protein
MATWTREELDKIGTADEIEIAPFRPDGKARNPVTIWIIRIGDELYARSAYGRNAAWFRGAQMRHEGRIRAGGIDKEVAFIDAELDLDDEIDTAYRNKYRRHGTTYVNMMVSAQARSATIKLVPRGAES